MMKRLLPLLTCSLLLALSLSACQEQTAPEMAHVRIPLGYIPNVQFAPLYVAVEKGFFAQEKIEVEFDYSMETDITALVGANQIPFGVVSGEQVLLARAQGLPVVYVAAWYQQYPISIIAKSEQNIQSPADLRGKVIGLPGLYGANYIGLRALLYVGGLSESEVTLNSIGYTQIEALASDRVQVAVVYTANEPVQLRAQGYALNELRLSDYLQLTSNGLITNEETISRHPELVHRMVRAFLKGLEYTLAHPDQAYEIATHYVENLTQANAEVQKQVLIASIELWRSARLGYSNPEAWQNMQAVLLDMGLLTKSLDLSKAFTNDFLP